MSEESVKGLLNEATLIIEGIVDASNFPARQPAPTHPHHVETDVVFLITRFLKGSLPQAQFPRIIVSEFGGRIGNISVATDEPLLQQGQHMLLFVKPDTRAGLPIVAGLPRYILVGMWNGKIQIDHDNKLLVPKHSIPELRQQHLAKFDVFAQQITTAVGVH